MNAAFFDISSRVKLRVSGADCHRFLNGQLTNNISKATETEAIQACVLTAKGKLNAVLFLRRDGDTFILDADAEVRNSLQPRFERYIIADDVTVVDETDRWSLFHILGPIAPDLSNDAKWTMSTRFREPGHDVWIETASRAQWLERLAPAFEFYDSDRAEILRIEQGLPKWGRELNENIIPVEAGLEGETIDYEKGCYVGQEVISRIKMSGQTNKRLCGMVSSNQEPLVAGLRLLARDQGDKEVGTVTSAAQSEKLGRPIGLGYVKRGFNKPGQELNAVGLAEGTPPLAVKLVDLPFESS